MDQGLENSPIHRSADCRRTDNGPQSARSGAGQAVNAGRGFCFLLNLSLVYDSPIDFR